MFLLNSPTRFGFWLIFLSLFPLWNCNIFYPFSISLISMFVVYFHFISHLLSLLFSFQDTLVGSSGLEPPTSRLSGVRSNHLSYEPISLVSFGRLSSSFFYPLPFSYLELPFRSWWRWGGSNSWPPACKAGALPAELHPRVFAFWVSFFMDPQN